MRTRKCKSWQTVLLLAAGLGLLLSPLTTQTACAEDVNLSGAGATFPYPLYSKWFNEYNKLHPEVKINYQSIGSGGGIRQFSEGTVYFGATDGPMTDEQLKASKVQPVIHLPMTLGGVVPVYNLPAVQGLRFSGETLARAFLGEIKTWNDPAIARDNPGKKLPGDAITIVHRSEGSGTTYVWVDYLSKVSPEFKQKVGVGASVTWPTGIGGKGNEGVSGTVQGLPGSLGYVEVIYALQNKISFGAVKNAAGDYVQANLAAISKAAVGAQIPADYRVSITNAPGPGVYPIASFTWLLVTSTHRDAVKDKVLKSFLQWGVTDGQKFSEALGYARLPEPLVKRELADIAKLP